jgi:2-succinyl-5-enolpyruvyl-6-hydroxy-3-cyclohexene-1-carboxylate synthase
MPVLDRDLAVLGNRGANGIDGFLSTGLGYAAASSRPTTLLAGDLSVLHDLTALATAARLGIPATIVAIHNDGGGIFHFLPQAGASEHFERHFGTPHGLDLVRLAAAFGVAGEQITTVENLQAAVAEPPSGPRFLEIRTNRTITADVHRRIREAVADALNGAD